MKFQVGTRKYDLVIVEGTIIYNGKSFASICHHERGQIEVSSTVPLELRPYVAAAAVSRAWQRQTAPWQPVPLLQPVWEE